MDNLPASSSPSQRRQGLLQPRSRYRRCFDLRNFFAKLLHRGVAFSEIYFDTPSAFDPVPNPHLLSNFGPFGISHFLLFWSLSYRKKITDGPADIPIPNSRHITSSVVQDGVTGRFLFLVYR